MEKPKNETGAEKLPEKASDVELVVFLIKHIDNPCGTKVGPEKTANIREFYMREAERVLSKMTSQDAKKLLELKIQEYKGKQT